MTFVTRFAPSPTGPLHLGHAYSALVAHDMAEARSGTFLLRIEDIDRSRARDAWEAQIYDDLAWLGLNWPRPVLRQSDRMDAYRATLDHLWGLGLLYPCTCTRADIAAALSAPQEGEPLIGPDGAVYPGTCRGRDRSGPRPIEGVLRLDIAAAWQALGDTPLSYTETGGEADMVVDVTQRMMIAEVGDIVLARRDMGTSYHLSVVVDDAHQGVTEVVRGRDLAEATAIHVLLQSLLNLPIPRYHHHQLIRDGDGKRLAKRDDARAIATYRADGATPEDIRAMVGLSPE